MSTYQKKVSTQLLLMSQANIAGVGVVGATAQRVEPFRYSNILENIGMLFGDIKFDVEYGSLTLPF